MLQDQDSIGLAAFFAFSGILISIYQILCHLRNYTEPVNQRYIIRIIFMVPVYAVGSFASLKWREGAIYFDTLRDCYEAWIIYNFSSLLLAYVGGPGAVVVKAEGKQVHPSWSHMTCCLPTMQVDGFFLRHCKQGTLQFVLMKPVMAALTLILYAAGAYTDGDMSPRDGYFYISILYNVCYTLALYGLMLFWIGASELLQPFNPLLKFVLVKTVVFLTFWQGIAISMINSMGRISDPEDGKALQNFMICIEMALAGISMLYAFPHKEYQIGGSAAGFRAGAFWHAISISDVVRDTIHVFAPSYSDYVLYTDGGPADNVKRTKYRGQKGNTTEHPKAALLKHMEKGVMAGAGEQDEPGGGGGSQKQRDAHRNQAILLDSDSDGIGSDDDGQRLGTIVASASDDDDRSLPPPPLPQPPLPQPPQQQRANAKLAAASPPLQQAGARRDSSDGSADASGEETDDEAASRARRRSSTAASYSAKGAWRGDGAATKQQVAADTVSQQHPSSSKGRRISKAALPLRAGLAGAGMHVVARRRQVLRGAILTDSDDDEESRQAPRQLLLRLRGQAVVPADSSGTAAAAGGSGSAGSQEAGAAGGSSIRSCSGDSPVRASAAVPHEVCSPAAAGAQPMQGGAAAAAGCPGTGAAQSAAVAPVPALMLPPPPLPRAESPISGAAAAATKLARAAAGSTAVSSSTQKTTDWDPGFPAAGDEQQQQAPASPGQQQRRLQQKSSRRQRGSSKTGGGGGWADEHGWSNVAL